MFDLTIYVKKWRIRQLKTVFSTLDTLWKLRSPTAPTLVTWEAKSEEKSYQIRTQHRARLLNMPKALNPYLQLIF